MLNEARSEADRIRVDAQARAEEARQQGTELLERAKQEADRVLLGLSERRETLVQHLQDMQTRLVGVAKELEVAIEDPDGIEATLSDDPEPVKDAVAPAVVQTAPADADHRRTVRSRTTSVIRSTASTAWRACCPTTASTCPASRRSSSTSTTIRRRLTVTAGPLRRARRVSGSARPR